MNNYKCIGLMFTIASFMTGCITTTPPPKLDPSQNYVTEVKRNYIPNLPIVAPYQDEKLAKFLVNKATAESLNFGLIDRILYINQNIENMCSAALQPNSAQSLSAVTKNLTMNPAQHCILSYGRLENLSVQDGSLQRVQMPTLYIEDHGTRYEHAFDLKINNLKFTTDGNTFIANGFIRKFKNSQGALILTDDLNLVTNVTHYTFKKFRLESLVAKDASISSKGQGELTLTKENSNQNYQLNFNNVIPWTADRTQVYPTIGELQIFDLVNLDNNFNLKAQTNTTSNRSQVLINDGTRQWSELFPSPNTYDLP